VSLLQSRSGVSVAAAEPVGRKRHLRGHRAAKRRKPRSQDKRRKTWSKGITSRERKNILGADKFAGDIGKPLNTTLDFHPRHLDEYPTESLDTFFAAFRVRLTTQLRRWGIGSYWAWMRENYEGERREHLQMVLHLPARGWAKWRERLETYVRRLPPYRGGIGVVQVGPRKKEFNQETGRWDDGLRYRMKQLRGDAVGPPGPLRLNRETKSRFDGAPVAPVYGQRCGVSETLSLKTERAWRDARQEHSASQPAERRFMPLKRGIAISNPEEPQTLVNQGVRG
jgi:hypothetical protein